MSRILLTVVLALIAVPAFARVPQSYYCNAPAGQLPDKIFDIDANGNVTVDWAMVEKHKNDTGCGVVLGALSAAHRGAAQPMGAAK